MKDVYCRFCSSHPMGSFMGNLSSVAAKLGAIAIKGALEKINLDPNLIDEVLMGQVVQAGAESGPGQTGSPYLHEAFQIQSVYNGQQSLFFGDEIHHASRTKYCAWRCRNYCRRGYGKYESNSALLPRTGKKFGLRRWKTVCKKTDSWMPTTKKRWAFAPMHVQNVAFLKDQDAFAIQSYKRSAEAWSSGKFDNEVVPLEVPQRRAQPCRDD